MDVELTKATQNRSKERSWKVLFSWIVGMVGREGMVKSFMHCEVTGDCINPEPWKKNPKDIMDDGNKRHKTWLSARILDVDRLHPVGDGKTEGRRILHWGIVADYVLNTILKYRFLTWVSPCSSFLKGWICNILHNTMPAWGRGWNVAHKIKATYAVIEGE